MSAGHPLSATHLRVARTGYSIREGSQILADRRAEKERAEETKQAQMRAGYARWLGRRYAIRGRM